MICPRCRARQFGVAANCTNCGKDLLPGRSPTLRLFAAVGAVLLLAAAAIIVANTERIPIATGWIALTVLLALVAAFAAAAPGSTARRYAERGRIVLRSDPRQALQDFAHATALDPKDDSFVPDRAEALSLLGQHVRAARDLQGYLRRVDRRPSDQITHARRILHRIENATETTAIDRPVVARQRVASPSVPNHVGIGSPGRSSGRRSSRSRAGAA